MVELASLWMPIVVSAAVVWVVSAMAWMVMPHHKNEFKGLPNEEAFLAAIRAQKAAPGQYMFPHCGDHSKMKDPAVKAKMDAGPWGTLNVFASWGNMGGKMAASFIFYLIVSTCVAYIASFTTHAGTDFVHVMRLTATVSIMAYCFATVPHAIWFNTPKPAFIAGLVDGITYGLITGATFAWLWPAAATITGIG